MKIGYIASHLYRHTFEINEVTEILRQMPEAQIYSFYRPRGDRLQRRRVEAISDRVVTWSLPSILSGLIHLLVHRPTGLIRGVVGLGFRSLPNPVYWFKNAAVFCIALPILADADRHRLDHLHANFGSSPATIAWLGKKVLGTGFSMTYHAFDIYSSAIAHRDPLKRRKLKDADLVVAVHRDGLERLRRFDASLPEERFKLIRISVWFESKAKSFPLPAPPLILAAGNLVPKKGFDVVIRAVSILKERDIPVRLRILGEGPERHALQSLAKRLRVADRTELCGYYQHEEFADHLAEAAVFVVPSRVTRTGERDGLPTVVVEAWLSRTPVVASLVGGMHEVIEDGKNGLVFPPEDAVRLADCTERLLRSKTLCESLTEGGTRGAASMFSAERNVGSLLAGIRDALPRGKRQTAKNA